MIKDGKKIKALHVIAIFFTVLGLYLRYVRLDQRSLWEDELLVVSQGQGALQPFWQQICYNEMTCFPGNYLVTRPFIQVFGYDKWGLAIPHLIATLCGFYFMYLICKKYLRSTTAQAITFAVMCFNANLVYHAFELRPYAVLALLGPAVFYCCGRLFDDPRPALGRERLLIWIFFVSTVAYHAYGILIVCFCLFYFLLRERGRRSWQQIIHQHLPFVSFYLLFALPIFAWYITGIPHKMHEHVPVFQFIANPLVDFPAFSKGVFGNLIGFKWFYPLLAVMALAFVLPTPQRLNQIGFFVGLIVLPISVVLVSDAIKEYWFLQRQFVWVMPLFAFLLGWCWESVLLYFRDAIKPPAGS